MATAKIDSGFLRHIVSAIDKNDTDSLDSVKKQLTQLISETEGKVKTTHCKLFNGAVVTY